MTFKAALCSAVICMYIQPAEISSKVVSHK